MQGPVCGFRKSILDIAGDARDRGADPMLVPVDGQQSFVTRRIE
jgi:hypothetical protein